MKKFSSILLLCLLFLHSFAYSTISEVMDLERFKEESSSFNKDDLILLDVDYTLLICDDAVWRKKEYNRKLRKQILEAPGVQYSIWHLLSIYRLKAKVSLIDEQSVAIVRDLQARDIPVITFSESFTGPYGMIEDGAEWRLNQLREFGFDCSAAFPDVGYLQFTKRKEKAFFPAFKSGALMATHHPKGEVLQEFLTAIQWMPKRVILIDDDLNNLKSVEEAVKQLGIDFIGFHYKVAENLSSQLNEKLAEFQFHYLAQHAEWLSDAEAAALMSQQ